LALILGASEFPGLLPGQEPSEAFRNSAKGIEQYFSSQDEGPDEYRVASFFDSDLNVIDLGSKIEAVLQDNSDLTDLILYYVGHGGFLADREYYLALKTTRQTIDHLTGLRISSLSAIINRRFADRRLFILLDCCFAGVAVKEWQSVSGLGKIIEHRTLQCLPPHGTALLVASSKDDPAISPGDRPYTMFCECLLDVLHKGIEHAGPTMSLDDVAERLRTLVNDRFGDYGSMPEIHSPRQHVGNIAKMALFSNPAYAAPALPDDLIIALSSALPKVRAGAVGTLEDYFATEDRYLSELAHRELERIAQSDDSTLVKNHAAEALARASGVSDGPEPAPQAGPADRAGEADDHPSHTELVNLISEDKPKSQAEDKPKSQETAPEGASTADPGVEPAGDAPQDDAVAPAGGAQDTVVEAAPTGAALAVTVRPSKRRVPPESKVTWTCKVWNTGETAVQAIEVTDAGGTQLLEPFSLDPSQERRFKFTKQYGQLGGQMTIAVLGRANGETLVSAEGSGRVSVHQVGRPAKPPAPNVTSQPHQPPTPTPTSPVPGKPVVDQVPLDVSRFRDALRRVKATAQLGEVSVNRLVRLLGDGELHYRVATGRLAAPPDWRSRVVDWIADVAALGTDELVMVKLTPPSPQEIVQSIDQLARHLEVATGVHIPTDEFRFHEAKE